MSWRGRDSLWIISLEGGSYRVLWAPGSAGETLSFAGGWVRRPSVQTPGFANMAVRGGSLSPAEEEEEKKIEASIFSLTNSRVLFSLIDHELKG